MCSQIGQSIKLRGMEDLRPEGSWVPVHRVYGTHGVAVLILPELDLTTCGACGVKLDTPDELHRNDVGWLHLVDLVCDPPTAVRIDRLPLSHGPTATG